MRTTVTIEDDLLKKASAAAGTTNRSEVLRLALKALIERDVARRLIQLGGSVPDAQLPPRRRPAPARRKRAAKK